MAVEDARPGVTEEVGVATVLIVDDDPAIVEVLAAYLRAEGHAVLTAGDGVQALPLLVRAHVAIIDWMLPGLSGLEVTAHARQTQPQLPVLLLTARGEVDDRLAGLDAGADDYVVKPFSPREVVARVRALLRRVAVRDEIESGGLTLDVQGRTATLDGQPLSFSRTEFDLLVTLAQHPGRIEPDLAGDLLGEAHVVDGALPRQHGRPLRDQTQHAPAPRLGGGDVADPDLAARGLDQVGDDAQERGLAAARRAQQGGEGPAGDLEAHLVQRPHRAEGLGQPLDAHKATVSAAAADPRGQRVGGGPAQPEFPPHGAGTGEG